MESSIEYPDPRIKESYIALKFLINELKVVRHIKGEDPGADIKNLIMIAIIANQVFEMADNLGQVLFEGTESFTSDLLDKTVKIKTKALLEKLQRRLAEEERK